MSMFLVFTLLFTTSLVALAAPAPKAPKAASTSLSASAQEIKVGETVTLAASTLKQGSDYSDSWFGATREGTYLDGAIESYVSTATFTGQVPGTYTIWYEITMSAGKSGVTFVGTASIEITVVQPAVIVGATIKNVSVTPTYNNGNGNLNGYNAIGDVYAVWSDDTETYYGKVNFHFSDNQTIRNLGVTINGVEYTVKNIVRP